MYFAQVILALAGNNEDGKADCWLAIFKQVWGVGSFIYKCDA